MSQFASKFQNALDTVRRDASNAKNHPWYLLVVFVIVLYTGLVATKLSRKTTNLLKSPILKMLMILLIAYISKHDITIALLLTIAFMVCCMTCLRNDMNVVLSEKFDLGLGLGITSEVPPPMSESGLESEEGLGMWDSFVNKLSSLLGISEPSAEEVVYSQRSSMPPPRVPALREPDNVRLTDLAYGNQGDSLEPVEEAPVLYTQKDMSELRNLDEAMEKKVAAVYNEVKKVEQVTGETVRPEQLKDICSRVSENYNFNKRSVTQVNDSYVPRLAMPSEVTGVPEGSMSMSSFANV